MTSSDNLSEREPQADEFADIEAPARLRDYAPEDYISLIVFWLLALDVFTQFFTRYVLGSSYGWTEEMARYLLISVTFLGGAMAVRRNSHIMVEMLYRYLPPRFGGWMSTLVDLVRIAFFGYAAYICWKLAGRTFGMMVSVSIPKKYLYYVVFAGLVIMTLRAIQVAWRHWRQGYSTLTHPLVHKPVD